jgi:hypothetical protein
MRFTPAVKHGATHMNQLGKLQETALVVNAIADG